MHTVIGPLVGLAAVDAILLLLLYLGLRAYAPLDRRALYPMGAGLAGFVFHAFMFLPGAFLVLQLTTYVGFIILYLLASRKTKPL